MLNFAPLLHIQWYKSTEDIMRRGISRFKVTLLSLASWCVLSVPYARAQKFDIGADFLIGLPQNEFRDKTREVGYGFDGHFGFFIGDTPVMIGADIGYAKYGTEKHREYLSDTIPEISVDVKTTNNILMLHVFARVQPQQGPVRPYFEGLYGFKYLFTRTSITDRWYDEPIASSTNYDDLAGSWGLGAGVDLRLWNGSKRRGVYDISLNLSARYLWGSKAGYMKKGSIIRDSEGGITYLIHHSRTDMLIPQFGIPVRF
jgi:hypothetical protein